MAVSLTPTNQSATQTQNRVAAVTLAMQTQARALATAEAFVFGDAQNVALIGPRGCGKSSVLRTVADVLEDGPGSVFYGPAEDWLQMPAYREPKAVIVDDFSARRNDAATHQVLRRIHGRVRRGLPTMVCLNVTERESLRRLPFAPRWQVAALEVPKVSERVLMVLRLADLYGIRIHPTLAMLMAHRLGSSCHVIHGGLKRLKVLGSDWSSKTAVLRGCAVLSPLLPASEPWDPRDLFADAVQDAMPDATPEQIQAYTTYVLMDVAGFQEAEVVAYFADSTRRVINANRTVGKAARRVRASQRLTLCKERVLSFIETDFHQSE